MSFQRYLIMIVDDESKIRRLVASGLESLGFDVIVAADGEHALELFEKAVIRPDLVLLDVMMPGMDGFECIEALRKIEDVPVIFLSARSEHHFKMQGFDAGADDYITKPFAMDELAARIRAVLCRATSSHTSSSQEAFTNGPLKLCPANCKAWVNDTELRLTDTEFRLLCTLMREPGTVMTHEHLLRAVWGPEFTGEVQYLRVAFARIRKKLEEAGLEGGVISAYSKVGYILRDLVTNPI